MHFNTFLAMIVQFLIHIYTAHSASRAQVSVKYTNHQLPKRKGFKRTMAYKAEIKQQSRNSAKNLYKATTATTETWTMSWPFIVALAVGSKGFFSLVLLKLCKSFAACIWKVNTRTHTPAYTQTLKQTHNYRHVLQLLANFPHNKIIHTFYAQSLCEILSTCAVEAL